MDLLYNIGILIYDQVEELDFIGPYEVLSYVNKINYGSTNVWLVSDKKRIIKGYNGLKFFSNFTIHNCPKLDVLIVPGGKGRNIAMKNKKILCFIKNRYPELIYLSSICTGALIIGATGLLTNKSATTYHTAFDELSEMGVFVKKSKVVQDGNIITGAGVSSGIDMGLYLLSKLFDKATAQKVSDKIEYIWHN